MGYAYLIIHCPPSLLFMRLKEVEKGNEKGFFLSLSRSLSLSHTLSPSLSQRIYPLQLLIHQLVPTFCDKVKENSPTIHGTRHFTSLTSSHSTQINNDTKPIKENEDENIISLATKISS